MTDTQIAPAETSALLTLRERHVSELSGAINNINQYYNWLVKNSKDSPVPERPQLIALESILSNLGTHGNYLVTSTAPSCDAIVKELDELLTHPVPDSRWSEAAERFKNILKEERFPELVETALKENNQTLLDSFLHNLATMDELYTPSKGFTAERPQPVIRVTIKDSAELIEKETIPGNPPGVLFTQPFPIATARLLLDDADSILLAPKLVKEQGSDLYMLMFSGTEAQMLRDTGVPVQESASLGKWTEKAAGSERSLVKR